MADSSNFDNLVEYLKAGLMQSNQQNVGFFFDGVAATWTEIFKLCDRTSMISDLRGVVKKPTLKANEFAALMARIDFLSASERDIRLRARSRVQGIRAAQQGVAQYAQDSLDYVQTQLQNIES